MIAFLEGRMNLEEIKHVGSGKLFLVKGTKEIADIVTEAFHLKKIQLGKLESEYDRHIRVTT